jgi:hypothetical protein
VKFRSSIILRLSLLDSGESQQSANRSCGRLYLVNLHISSKVVVAVIAVRQRTEDHRIRPSEEVPPVAGSSVSSCWQRDGRLTGVAERYAILERRECQAKTAIPRLAVGNLLAADGEFVGVNGGTVCGI